MSEKFDNSKIKELKKVIDSHLRSKEVYSEIRKIITEFSKEDNLDTENTDVVLQIFKERGVLQNLISSLETKTSISTSEKKEGGNTVISQMNNNNGSLYLHLKLLGGKGFLDYETNQISLKNKYLQISLNYEKQRFKSSFEKCETEPKFSDDFIIDLLADSGIKNVSEEEKFLNILQNNRPIHIILYEVDKNVGEGEPKFIGSHHLEWRKVLKNGIIGIQLEIGGINVGDETDFNSPFTKGILNLRLELLPLPGFKFLENQILSQINIEKTSWKKSQREFFLYSQKWYQEFIEINPQEFKKRLIKIYSQNEENKTLPVTCWLQPLNCSRLLETPFQCLRFVSLMDNNQNNSSSTFFSNPSGKKKEIWLTLHCFLNIYKSKKNFIKSFFINKNLLLCNLLLGFGMNAYIGIGFINNEASTFIITKSGKIINIWDIKQGVKYNIKNISAKFQTLDCVFNDKQFYANIQNTNQITDINFNFSNSKLWKSMSKLKISLIPKLQNVFLSTPTINPVTLSSEIEMKIQRRVEIFRNNLGLSTKWNSNLSMILSPALYAYEQERVSGISQKSTLFDFQASIKRSVKQLHTFKAFPLHSTSSNINDIFTKILNKKSSKDILETVGDQISFGIRCKTIVYPENVLSIWIIIAVSFLNVKKYQK